MNLSTLEVNNTWNSINLSERELKIESGEQSRSTLEKPGPDYAFLFFFFLFNQKEKSCEKAERGKDAPAAIQIVETEEIIALKIKIKKESFPKACYMVRHERIHPFITEKFPPGFLGFILWKRGRDVI